MKKINAINKTVLVISDTHIPYSHQDYIVFLEAIKKKYKPQIITHIGDEVDGHAISFHKNETSLFNADEELEKAIEEIENGLHRLFKKMYLIESNHGSLIFRRLKSEGLPLLYLKPLHKIKIIKKRLTRYGHRK